MKGIEVTGGQYTAIQAKDGTWTIKDVPIFAEHSREIGPKSKIVINRDWLAGAFEKSKQRFDLDNYMGPVHVNHHGMGKETTRVGFFMPTDIRKMSYEGKDKWVLFADFIGISSEIYQRIKSGELPYRSVEIHDVDNPEIGSLALLEDDVPYFRFPIFTIGKELKAANPAVMMHESEKPVLAYKASGKSTAFLMRFCEDTEMGKKVKYEEHLEKELTEEKEKAEGKKEEQVKSQEEMDMMSMLKEVLSLVKALHEELVEGEKEELPMEPKEEGGPVEMQSSGEPSKYAAMAGRYDALEARFKKFERERDVEKQVQGIVKELAGYNLGETLPEKLMVLAEKHGMEALKAYADAVKSHAPKEPPSSLSELEGMHSDSDEVLKYSNRGPDALLKAREYSKLYDQVKHKTQVSLEDFISAQFEAEAENKLARRE